MTDTVSLVFTVVAYIVNATYSYCWDVCKDWGLLELDYGLLRRELVYRSCAYYYLAIVEDFALRYTWVARVSLKHVNFDMFEYVTTALLTLEIIRCVAERNSSIPGVPSTRLNQFFVVSVL